MPYAAKSIVQHEFDTDHLNVWLEFRLPMNQLVMPLLNKWILCVDDVTKTVSVSAWQDEYTLLLTVPDIAATPDRVLLQYTGPGPICYLPDDPDRKTLETTWQKQWQPFGPILSIDRTSIPCFVDRGNPQVPDFTKDNFTADDDWHELDLSSIVPAGVKLVLCWAFIRSEGIGDYFHLRAKGKTGWCTGPGFRTQSAANYNDQSLFCAVDSNRKIEYKALPAEWMDISLTIQGWFF